MKRRRLHYREQYSYEASDSISTRTCQHLKKNPKFCIRLCIKGSDELRREGLSEEFIFMAWVYLVAGQRVRDQVINIPTYRNRRSVV